MIRWSSSAAFNVLMASALALKGMSSCVKEAKEAEKRTQEEHMSAEAAAKVARAAW